MLEDLRGWEVESGKDIYDLLRKYIERRSRNSPLWSEDVTFLNGVMTYLLRKVDKYYNQKRKYIRLLPLK